MNLYVDAQILIYVTDVTIATQKSRFSSFTFSGAYPLSSKAKSIRPLPTEKKKGAMRACVDLIP